QEDARALAYVVPRPLDELEHGRAGRSDDEPRALREKTERGGDLGAGTAVRVAEARGEERSLSWWCLEKLEERVRGRALAVVDPRRVQDRVGVVGDERPFLWIHRDERHARMRLAPVVVPHLLLFHRDRRDIR